MLECSFVQGKQEIFFSCAIKKKNFDNKTRTSNFHMPTNWIERRSRWKFKWWKQRTGKTQLPCNWLIHHKTTLLWNLIATYNELYQDMMIAKYKTDQWTNHHCCPNNRKNDKNTQFQKLCKKDNTLDFSSSVSNFN